MCLMSRVFISAGTGAAVYVLANDHCPPHVHAKHRGEEWIARVGFSYLNTNVKLLSIAPTKNIPGQRVINRLLEGTSHAQLSSCRHHWWMTLQTTCLVNQWSLVTAPGAVDLLPQTSAGCQANR